MSCPTIADAPWFGSSPCSGHGACDNLTQLCTCDGGYSGGGDLFDLRVVPGVPSQATDCGLSLLGVRIAWSITFAFMLFRTLTNIAAIGVQLSKGKGRKRSNVVLHVLLMDFFVSHPFFIGLVVLKLFYGQVIGTDPAVTALFALGVPFTFFTINHFAVHEFKIIQVSTSSDLFHKFSKSAYMAPVLYFLFSSIPTLISLALDKTKGPIASGQVAVLLIRILMVCVFQVIGFLNAVRFAKEARSILDAQSNGLQDSVKDKALKIVEYMNNQALTLKKKAIVLLLLHAPFLTPYLWQQQAILIAISISLISLTNPSLSILGMHWAMIRTAQQSDSGTRNAEIQASSPKSGNLKKAIPKEEKGSSGNNAAAQVAPSAL